MTKIETINLSKSYDNREIIKNINITLNNRELVSLLGISGTGKTTLFHIIAGLVLPDSGQVLLDGNNITGQPGKISYMLQKDLLFPYKKIIDNICLPLSIKGTKKHEARKQVLPYFQEFGLQGTEYKYPHQLSGGMRQRVALLRSYIAATGIALLDEPFSALDTITKTSMHTWYLNIMQRINLSTLFITHDIDEAIFLSDRIYILGGNPAKIIDEIQVIEKRPRSKEFLLTETFLKYKRHIIEKLNI